MIFFILFHGYGYSEIIEVMLTGMDDGVIESKRHDRDQAILDAKTQAIEKAGCKISATTELINDRIMKNWVARKAKAFILPGYKIEDIGYVENTYKIVFYGKVSTEDLSTPKKTVPKTQSRYISSSCKCENFNYVCKDTLWGFNRGSYKHLSMDRYIKMVKANLYGHHTKNIRRITITGYADGHENRGVDNWRHIPNTCNPKRKKGKLFDKDLAKIRACMVRLKIEKGLMKHAIKWSPQHVDYPTGTHMKDNDRKVVVQYFLNKEECNE